MNVLGVKISVDRDPSAAVKWSRRTGAMGTAIVLVAGTGVAYASWSANGAGAGAAKAGTSQGVTATAQASVSTTGGTLLVPGGSVPAVVNITNPNNFDVTVSALSITAEAAPDGVTGGTGTPVACSTTNAAVSMSASSPSGLNVVIPKNSSGTVVTPANIISMGAGSANGCQGATFVFNTGVSVTAGS